LVPTTFTQTEVPRTTRLLD